MKTGAVRKAIFTWGQPTQWVPDGRNYVQGCSVCYFVLNSLYLNSLCFIAWQYEGNFKKWAKIPIPHKCLAFFHEKNEYLFDSLHPRVPRRTKGAVVLINHLNSSFDIEVGGLDSYSTVKHTLVELKSTEPLYSNIPSCKWDNHFTFLTNHNWAPSMKEFINLKCKVN